MGKFKEHVKYKISRQVDGSYVILKKDRTNNVVDIHSHYDTYEDANDALIDLYHKPSQIETMEFLSDLKDSIKNI